MDKSVSMSANTITLYNCLTVVTCFSLYFAMFSGFVLADKTQCTTEICVKYEICERRESTFRCHCPNGYEGASCEIRMYCSCVQVLCCIIERTQPGTYTSLHEHARIPKHTVDFCNTKWTTHRAYTTGIDTHTHIHAHARTRTHTHSRTRARAHARTRTHARTPTHARTHARTHTHTHTHTHMLDRT